MRTVSTPPTECGVSETEKTAIMDRLPYEVRAKTSRVVSLENSNGIAQWSTSWLSLNGSPSSRYSCRCCPICLLLIVWTVPPSANAGLKPRAHQHCSRMFGWLKAARAVLMRSHRKHRNLRLDESMLTQRRDLHDFETEHHGLFRSVLSVNPLEYNAVFLTKIGHNLRKLDFLGCTCSPEVFVTILRTCPKLKSLTIPDFGEMRSHQDSSSFCYPVLLL